uniref:Mitochondrial enolase superfamily member 1 n=1 Tax=Cacopsylla melanoneura TaxID=428564 RepID=A0A8D9E2D4_9HEMI
MSAFDMQQIKIVDVQVQDVRFPTSLQAQGSDAMHKDPDYSCAYVSVITSNPDLIGYGLTFTLGRGTEIVCTAVEALSFLFKDQWVHTIFSNFGQFWDRVTNESQLRWLGPSKGVTHLAVAALMNALWDLWAKIEGKPLWRLLVDMSPEQLVNTLDFRYISDLLTKEEALEILKHQRQNDIETKIDRMTSRGYPAYTTATGWIGYSDEKVIELCKKYLALGFTAFKIKVGINLEDDKRRCKLMRDMIGQENLLMVDANQRWEVEEAIQWMQSLAEYTIYWIEEPTSPDDILGHRAISQVLEPLGIKVASGEVCCNKVMFKQFLASEAIQVAQIDSCRLGSINEILPVYLMAYKLKVPVCPHAGGVGLSEMVQHLQVFDYICLSQTLHHRLIEFVDQETSHFVHPVRIENAHYIAPTEPGYSTELKKASIEEFKYPNGTWYKQFINS